jgi:hypothetical protein
MASRKLAASVILGLASVGVSVGAAVGAHAGPGFWGPWGAISCAVVAGTLAAAAVFVWTNVWTKWLAVPIFVGVAVGMGNLLIWFGVSCSRFCS